MMQVPEILRVFLRALASPARQQILLVFSTANELSVKEIANRVDLGVSTTSEHLSELARAGLLIARRKGKLVYYRPDPLKIRECVQQLISYLNCCCPMIESQNCINSDTVES